MGRKSPQRPPAVKTPPVHPNVQKAMQGIRDNAQLRLDAASELGLVLPPKEFPVTPREAIGRWYENAPDGLEKAALLSKKSLVNSPADGLYGHWWIDHLDSPTQLSMSVPGLDPWKKDSVVATAGRRVPESLERVEPYIQIRKGKGNARQAVLDHELTHSLLFGDWADPKSPIAEALLSPPEDLLKNERNIRHAVRAASHGDSPIWRRPAGLGVDEWGDMDTLMQHLYGLNSSVHIEDIPYLVRRSEVDPRVAEIRRRYSWETGEHVKNKDDAAKAWEWWKTNQDRWHKAPADRPTMSKGVFNLYDSLPADAKNRMLLRMTQVPAILGGLMGAASQDSQQ